MAKLANFGAPHWLMILEYMLEELEIGAIVDHNVPLIVSLLPCTSIGSKQFWTGPNYFCELFDGGTN
jgi:hypothetical protein